jgi:hypothetical protein
MWFFRAISNLSFMRSFRDTAIPFVNLHDEVDRLPLGGRGVPGSVETMDEYAGVRSKLARDMQRANEIAGRSGAPYAMQIYRPPMFGGGYFGTISIFESLLEAELPFGVKIPRSKLWI